MQSPLTIIVTKDDILSCNIGPTLNVLKDLGSSPDMAMKHMENVDIAFDGYNNHTDDLFEIPGVRKFIFQLDDQFPYWLFFLSKKHLGLQALLLCLLPYLNEEARLEQFPDEINTLLTNRWLPALYHMCELLNLSDNDRNAISERTVQYIFHGPLRIMGIVKEVE